jgi:hypothetical protein
MTTRPSLAHCPSCQRFIGTTTECPYCGTETSQRRSIVILRSLAFIMSIGGLLGLLFIP